MVRIHSEVQAYPSTDLESLRKTVKTYEIQISHSSDYEA